MRMIPSPVVLDGFMYAAIAMCTFSAATFGGDEAAKYVTPVQLFWLKYTFGILGAGLLATKMYRSTTFAEYKAAKNGSFHATEVIIPKTNEDKSSISVDVKPVSN